MIGFFLGYRVTLQCSNVINSCGSRKPQTFHGYAENKETKEFRWNREEKTDDPSHEQNGFLMKPKQKKTPVSTGKGKEERKKSQ
ncbi:uncharacterized protein TNCV_2459461 [Trichonephila clavipes]|nr:uncharacterized protein TNCV_2459461 [Trichonephila clavipes]